jgi:transcriptional regulator with XRE-family HTH domain
MTTMHDLTTFGGLLADLRERRGLSQFTLSINAGYSPNFISRLECGNRHPSRETIAVLAEALALDADDTGRLYVSAGLLPPGTWTYMGWCIRPAEEEATP